MVRKNVSKNTKTEEKKSSRKFGNVDFENVAVKEVREFQNGNVGFTLYADGMLFYNLVLVEWNDEQFISYPARKGSDGTYYKYYYLNLTEETTARIIDAVNAEL